MHAAAAAGSGAKSDACCCRHPPFHFADFVSEHLGEDRHGAEISLATCKRCATRWIHYLVEEPHYSRSGRWWRVEVPPQGEYRVSVDDARSLVARSPEGFAGGSYHGSQGYLVMAPIHVF